MWRMVDDVWDTWRHFTHLIDICRKWYPYIAPGTWPDCDMIPLGRISIRGERGEDRMTRLTKDEQYSLMTLFTLFKSPLMFGGDLPSNDDFTLSLLTNKEVLRMHRESTDVHELFNEDGKVAIVSKNPNDGSIYLGVFNISDNPEPMEISLDMTVLGFIDDYAPVNLWTGQDSGNISGEFKVILKPHACGLYRVIR